MKNWKLLIMASLLMALASGLYVSANCSAQATACNVSCSVTAPPGGSTQCRSSATMVVCRAFDSSGAQCKYIKCNCAPPPAFPCIAMVPTC